MKTKYLLLFFICFFNASCSLKSGDLVSSAQRMEKKSPEKALLIYDRAFQRSKKVKEKLKILTRIEKLIKTKIKRADLLQGALDRKVSLLEDSVKKNKVLLDLAQLALQNLKNSNIALSYLDQISYEDLNGPQRESYFKLVIVSYLNDDNYEQAVIEADEFLAFKDLTPSERFKIEILKSKAFVAKKENIKAIENYEKLLNKYPNLSKTWKVRSQLAILFEEQRDYSRAIENLQVLKKDAGEKDSLLEWRIKELQKRLAQQPGQSGRLRR